jgi:hypothetical protein
VDRAFDLRTLGTTRELVHAMAIPGFAQPA